ncbi:hypothetical protein [Haloglomus salinum]|jgi:hypothetical protein|uniref:hypothetical protein n=1 Tax=Haloglomus salinum TaxID=2962673 RepID=UPI0020C9405C|nr:hypothetical protein [Haloglomus salinum]
MVEGDSDDETSADPPTVPVLGRPLVRAEFWAILLALAAVAFGSLAVARALGAVAGDPWLIGAAAVAQAGLAGHYARRPVGYARGTLPVPAHWYRIIAVLTAGVAAGAVAALLLG